MHQYTNPLPGNCPFFSVIFQLLNAFEFHIEILSLHSKIKSYVREITICKTAF